MLKGDFMIYILAGLPVVFTLICMFSFIWSMNDFDDVPYFMQVIGVIGWALVLIGILLCFSYFVGEYLIELIKHLLCH